MKEELLEQLLNRTNRIIISDLRFVNNDVLYEAIKSLNSNDYSLIEWQDAVAYLTGCEIDKKLNKEEAKEYLCSFYCSKDK